MTLPLALPLAVPLLGIGVVRHQRLRPVVHAFSYRTWFVMLPLRSMHQQPESALARTRPAWVSFYDRDHGMGGDDCVAWLEGLLRTEGIADADGEVWLHTYPRVLGYVFKPVSFWYCHRRDGSLATVVVEVNNTFGERHVYLLHGAQLMFGRQITASKAFAVSPFCAVRGRYRFRFMRTDPVAAADPIFPPVPATASAVQGAGRTVARIDYDDDDGPLLVTSVSGSLVPLTAASLRRAVGQMPLLTLGIIWRIHWQALRLLVRRVPFFGKPALSAAQP